MRKPVENMDGIEAGMGGVYGCWTDRYPFRVVKVTRTNMTIVQLDLDKNVGGPWPAQRWTFGKVSANTPTYVVRRNKNGQYRRGNWRYGKPAVVSDDELGAMVYLDPCF